MPWPGSGVPPGSGLSVTTNTDKKPCEKPTQGVLIGYVPSIRWKRTVQALQALSRFPVWRMVCHVSRLSNCPTRLSFPGP